MRLKNYTPSGRQIVLHLKAYGQVGAIIMPDAVPDKILKILAAGDLCEKAKAGDYVMLGPRDFLQMEMDDENGKPITVLFADEFAIMGYYVPDPDEEKFYVAVKNANGMSSNDTRELNIFDNPGLEASPYLKEEAQNKTNLENQS
jgi:hypothetical protein